LSEPLFRRQVHCCDFVADGLHILVNGVLHEPH
jgi:hypothetical protein